MNALVIPVEVYADPQNIELNIAAPKELTLGMETAVIVEGDTPPVLISKQIDINGTFYAATYDADGFSMVDVAVPTGLIIPEGFAYYNGYLLPKVPTVEGYDFMWIRQNNQTGEYNAIYGTSPWYALSNSSLTTWTLTFAELSTLMSRQYNCSQSNPTVWTEGTPSANNYGTGSDRKPIFANYDIFTSSAKTTTLYKQGFAVAED